MQITNAQVQATVQPQLINTFIATIGDAQTHAVKASELHSFMQVATKFADWITARIEKYGFVENQDFVIASEKSEAKRGEWIWSVTHKA